MPSNAFGVYALSCDRNSRAYIGAAHNSFSTRWGSHLLQLEAGNHPCVDLQADWSMYGREEFSFSPLIACAIRSEVYQFERRAIRALRREMNLYNGPGCDGA